MRGFLIEAARWSGAFLLCIIGLCLAIGFSHGVDWLFDALSPWLPLLFLVAIIVGFTVWIRYGVFK